MEDSIEINNQITVSVWMVTYNHENYIELAIESIMMQKTNFSYKLFIGEDFSNDRTRKICIELSKKYPSKIELILHKKNLGSNSNGVFMYQHCSDTKAKYIALCEGDDFWTDPYKLQKQVDFLEANEDCSLAVHKVQIMEDGRNSSTTSIPSTQKESNYFTFENLIKNWDIQTSSFLFRNYKDLSISIQSLVDGLVFGDVGLVYYLLTKGKIHYSDEVMSVYRLHETSSTAQNNNNAIEKSIRFGEDYNILLDRFNQMSNYKFNILIHQKKATSYIPIADFYHLKKDFKKVRLYLKKVLKENPHEIIKNKRIFFVLLLKSLIKK